LRAPGLLLLLLFPSTVAPSSEEAGRSGSDHVVASVDGIEIRKSDVADAVLLFSRPQYVEALRECVQRILVDREAERLGVSLSDEAIEKALAEEIAHEKSAVMVQFGGKVAFADFVRDNFRMTEEAYGAAVRRAVRTKLLLARVVRYGASAQEGLSLRTITVRDRAKAEELRAKLREGADFIALARRESVDPSAKEGGKLPPVTRGVLHPEVERVVFALEPGEVSDVVTLSERGETSFHLFRLLERHEPIDRPYAAVADAIERDLRTTPLEPHEVAQWNRMMETMHEVRIAGPGAPAVPPSTQEQRPSTQHQRKEDRRNP
jgi:peptidyl-prolyl cis-trans isomerase C